MVVLPTDEQSEESAAFVQTASTNRHALAGVFAIGVGELTNVTQLQASSSRPSSSHVFAIGFSDLTNTALQTEIARVSWALVQCIQFPLLHLFFPVRTWQLRVCPT